MGFDDWYRLSVHAVITDPSVAVMLLKAAYGDSAWGLPGGALDPGETIHEGLRRECYEELGCEVDIDYLSGVYSHVKVKSHAFVFRCSIRNGSTIELSDEHSEFRYFRPEEMHTVQRQRVIDCLEFTGEVRSARF
jgi:8-oxo-dGTP diphosphatase